MTTEHAIPTGTLKQVLLKDITVPERFRKNFGDMDAFVEGIKEKGILQPITLSSDLTLLAGGRRYKGATMAGLEKIPALIRKVEIDQIDYIEVELMENVERKDFEWQERCAAVWEIDRLYKERNFDWSGRKTAQLLNKSVMNIQRDLELANAIKVIPELALQATASDAYKMLKKLEEDVIVEEMARRQRERYNFPNVDGNSDYQNMNLDGTPAVDESGEPTAERSPNWQHRPFTVVQRANFDYQIGDVFEGLKGMMNDGVVHLIECDPPYGIDLAGVKASKDSVDSTIHGYEEVPTDKYVEFLTTLASELYRVAGKDCWLIFWYGPTWHTEVKLALQTAKWHVDDIPAIWVKGHGQTLQPEVYLARTYEPFFLCRKGSPYMANRGRANVFQYSGLAGVKKYHPTERPVDLIKDILSTLGVAGQMIFVPFLGSGATLRACYQLDMRGYGFDLNDQYKSRFLLAVEDDIQVMEQTKEQ